jgi:hypothetical protein
MDPGRGPRGPRSSSLGQVGGTRGGLGIFGMRDLGTTFSAPPSGVVGRDAPMGVK